MPERPLLLFPQPQSVNRTKRISYFGKVHIPTHSRQSERLSPIFNQLQEAFNSRQVEIQQSAAGIDPEQVLVIETIGSIENFANAVKKIEGLEWMGELDVDDIVPDEDFYDETKPEKELSGRLYLVMTNQRALEEMLSLWRRYKDNPDMTFQIGLTKFRDVFTHLKDIRRWDVQDRFLDTGIVDAWQEDLKYDGDRPIKFEIELWFRNNLQKRQFSQSHVSKLVQQKGGRILSQCVIEEIAYHALLAQLPAKEIQKILDDPFTELIKCDNIMFFRPVGQMVVGNREFYEEMEVSTWEELPQPTGKPVIALLDGMPLANHQLLAGRIEIDDPDNWEEDYPAVDRVHGTSMASLIIHGDFNSPSYSLPRPIYVRPIMKPLNWHRSPRPEGIPEDCLVVDLVHKAVKRMFEGDDANEPIAPSIKIINFSIGDPGRQFVQMMSPLARLLDWLSVKYNVLFIISAGNHVESIPLGIPREKFVSLQPEKVEEVIIKALYQNIRHRRLLAPAESINGITVGAVSFDNSESTQVANRFDPFVHILPSPVSAFGNGYRRAIKPDMVFMGGRIYYQEDLRASKNDNYVIKPVDPPIRTTPPGNKVAVPGNQPGDLSYVMYSCGTSNAAALISRAAGICYETLLQILQEQSPHLDTDIYIAPLLKAMLVHSCAWNDLGTRIADILRTPDNGRQLRNLVSRWIGYGMPNIERVLDCTEQRVTLLGFGHLRNDEAHIFRLPLPPSLAAQQVWRRLTITLAWFSPISTSSQKYRVANLWFEANNPIAPDRSDADWRAVRRGTVQHEVFEGKKAEPFVDGDAIEIKVNCREDTGKIVDPIPYGIAVSLEVKEEVNIPVYEEVKARIAPTIRIQNVYEYMKI